jgi:radical SAM superfamily enzyme YgiQ (UPF0313 family)
MFERQGYSVAYWDDRWDSIEEFDDIAKQASNVGVSAFTGYQCARAAELLKRAKQLNPSVTTHIGGHHARLLTEQCKAEPYIDKVWPGRVYGEDLFPWHDGTKKLFARGDLQYYTSRGCPFPCTFCALSSPWEPKPIDALRHEMTTIHEATGHTEVSFSDPNIGFGAWKEGGVTKRMDRVQRIRDIGAVMRDLGMTWDGNIRSPYFSPEMVEALSWSGCTSIEIGCESGDDWFLRRVIRKGHGVEAIKNAARVVRGSGVSVMYSFIMYMPRETHDQRMATADLIDWIVDTDPAARVSVYKYAPYPGSPMYDDAVTGVDGYPRFEPPNSLEGWGNLKLMVSPIYWIAGLAFRLDNTKANFKGEDWRLIEPYVKLAQSQWEAREFDSFPVDEVESLVAAQVRKRE